MVLPGCLMTQTARKRQNERDLYLDQQWPAPLHCTSPTSNRQIVVPRFNAGPKSTLAADAAISGVVKKVGFRTRIDQHLFA